MLIVVADGVLDAKVIDKEDEDYRTSFIFEECGCVSQLAIAILSEVQDNFFISKAAGLWYPVHDFNYLYIYMDMVYESGEVEGSKYVR